MMRAWQRAVFLAMVAAGAFIAPARSDAPRFEERVIFPTTPGRGHVHASSVIETPSGGLIAAWYENGEPQSGDYYLGTDADKRSDVRIGAARFLPGASTWSEPFVISDTFGVSDNNPMLAVDAAKRLWLIHPTMLAVPERTWGSALLQYKVSSDYQQTGPPRWDREGILVIAVSISTDDRKTWGWTRHLENRPGERLDYPSMIQARDGALHATYSYNLSTIKHVVFDEAWVRQGDGARPSADLR